MEVITSIKNNIVLQTIKNKNSKDKIFLEGIKLIKEAISYGLNLNYYLILNTKQEILKKEFSFLFDSTYYLISDNVMKKLAETKSPQGIIGIFDFKNEFLAKPENNFLVLENIQDPGNLGTIIRSASGTSFKEIYLINCVYPYNQKVIRSSMGGLFKERIYIFKDISDFISFATNYKLKLIVATMEGKNLFNFKKPAFPFGIVIGNEGNGVSNTLKNFAFDNISIPMANDLESLNAGVSCSIIIYCLDNIKSN